MKNRFKPGKYLAVPFLAIASLGCYTVLEKSLDNAQVTLTAPVNNLVTSDTAQTFYWEPVESATSYQLQLVSPRFDSIARFVMDSTVDRNLLNVILYKGQYQWRVKALNSGSASPFSAPGNLTIQ